MSPPPFLPPLVPTTCLRWPRTHHLQPQWSVQQSICILFLFDLRYVHFLVSASVCCCTTITANCSYPNNECIQRPGAASNCIHTTASNKIEQPHPRTSSSKHLQHAKSISRNHRSWAFVMCFICMHVVMHLDITVWLLHPPSQPSSNLTLNGGVLAQWIYPSGFTH